MYQMVCQADRSGVFICLYGINETNTGSNQKGVESIMTRNVSDSTQVGGTGKKTGQSVNIPHNDGGIVRD